MRDVPSIARTLVDSGALKFGTYTSTSGVASPNRIDLAWPLSSPQAYRSVIDVVVAAIRDVRSSPHVDKLATIALKGAPLLPGIAEQMDLPCLVVRKAQKTYGVTGWIAGGAVNQGNRVLFFDDVVSSDQSKLEGSTDRWTR